MASIRETYGVTYYYKRKVFRKYWMKYIPTEHKCKAISNTNILAMVKKEATFITDMDTL